MPTDPPGDDVITGIIAGTRKAVDDALPVSTEAGFFTFTR